MIELPSWAVPSAMSASFVDQGFTQRGISTATRVQRKGSRYRIDLTLPPYMPDDARVIVQRLIRGKQEGLRVELPVLHPQGVPGSPLVDGAVTTGRSVPVKGLTPGYICKEGYWLSFEVSGQHYLHQAATTATADSNGDMTLTLNEMLRVALPDEAVVHLAKPMIEGIVEGDDFGWGAAADRLFPIQFSLEEAQ